MKVNLKIARHLQHLELTEEACHFCGAGTAAANALADFNLDVFSGVKLKVTIQRHSRGRVDTNRLVLVDVLVFVVRLVQTTWNAFRPGELIVFGLYGFILTYGYRLNLDETLGGGVVGNVLFGLGVNEAKHESEIALR